MHLFLLHKQGSQVQVFSLFDHGETPTRVFVNQSLPLERVTSQEFPTQTFPFGYRSLQYSFSSPHGSQHGSQHGTPHEPRSQFMIYLDTFQSQFQPT